MTELSPVAGGTEAYDLFSWIEGNAGHMSGIVISDGFLPLFLETHDDADTLYAELGLCQHALVAKVIRRGLSTIIEYGSGRQPYISGKVPLATGQHLHETSFVLGAFRLLDTERSVTREYNLKAQIQDIAPGVRYLQGHVSSCRA